MKQAAKRETDHMQQPELMFENNTNRCKTELQNFTYSSILKGSRFNGYISDLVGLTIKHASGTRSWLGALYLVRTPRLNQNYTTSLLFCNALDTQ